MPIHINYEYFGRNATRMKEYFDLYNASTDNDKKSTFDPLYQLQKEVGFIWLQWYMEQARDNFVNAGSYERSKERFNQRNGYNPHKRVLLKGIGEISLLVPQVRKNAKEFYRLLPMKEVPEAFKDFVTDLVLKGHSAESARQILADHFSVHLSKQAILDMLDRFKDEYIAWANRPLPDEYPYIFVDGKWYDVLENGEKHRKVAILVLGLKEDLTSDILAFNLVDSESVENGMAILANVRERGVRSVKLITSDASFRTAAKATWINAEYQACAKHKLDNVMQNTSNKRRARCILKDAAAILRLKSVSRRNKAVAAFVQKWEVKEPRVVKNFVTGLPECFTYLSITRDERLRRKLRTSNPIERYIREVNRKLKDLGYFHSVQRGKLWLYLIVRTIAAKRSCGKLEWLKNDELEAA